MDFYKLYTEMMAQGEYNKLERDGQGNMKDRRALLQQGTLDKDTSPKQIVPDWMMRNFSHIFNTNMKEEMTYKELYTIVEKTYKVRILNKGEIYRPRADSLRFIVVLNSSKIILAEGDAIHEDLVHIAMLANLLPMKSGWSGFNFTQSFMFNKIVAFYYKSGEVYLSESYDTNATNFYEYKTNIMKKCNDLIKTTLVRIKKIAYIPAQDVED